jgi:isopenicillin-N epimerase
MPDTASTTVPAASPALTRPGASPLAAHWMLDPDLVYLNHGSFGACPRAVLDAQSRYRAQMERDSVSFFMGPVWDLLNASRESLAGMLGGEAGSYVFLPNATTAVTTVLDNFARGAIDGKPLGPGDEILMTTHEYPACRFNAHRIAERCGARAVETPFPTPATHATPISADDIVGSVLAGVTERTRIAMLSHITSSSAAVMPMRRITDALRERGIPTLIDGAHGAGAVDFDLPSLGGAFYTANCHKWLSTPKGVALLWVHPDHHESFRPLVLSNDAHTPAGKHGRSRLTLEFDYIGTDDYTPMCAVADAVRTIPEIAGTDWAGVCARNRDLALRGRAILCERLGLEPAYSDELIGPMVTLLLPRMKESRRAAHAARPTVYHDALQDDLLARHAIQVPIWRFGAMKKGDPFDGQRCVRISAQLYNTEAQYAYLADALAVELERERSG